MLILIANLVQSIEPNMIQQLWNQYGIAGLLFGLLLALLIRQSKKSDKRIADLETQQQETHSQNLQNHKEMIEQYITLVREKNGVLAKLTACLDGIKDTLDRIERKQEDKN